MKEDKDAKDGKKKDKVKAVEKSLVVLEVKPWEADTDLKMVWEKIKEYQQEGLSWGEAYKLEPVAYGIMKLVMTATIVDRCATIDIFISKATITYSSMYLLYSLFCAPRIHELTKVLCSWMTSLRTSRPSRSMSRVSPSPP